jgi:hypothetical protein
MRQVDARRRHARGEPFRGMLSRARVNRRGRPEYPVFEAAQIDRPTPGPRRREWDWADARTVVRNKPRTAISSNPTGSQRLKPDSPPAPQRAMWRSSSVQNCATDKRTDGTGVRFR